MRRILAPRPSPAMVVACLALAVALGGTGYAAIKLPRNSVGAAQLKRDAVTSNKVRDGSLTARDLVAGALLTGPRGPRGAAGPSGIQGPRGDSVASGSLTGLGFASRDPANGATPIPLGPAAVEVLGLNDPAGTAAYVASSGPVTAVVPSRVIAEAQAVVVNAAAGSGDVGCRIALVASDIRLIGNVINASIAGGGYIPLTVSAGADIQPGTYNVRMQCSSGSPSMSFHRGNLTVVLVSR